MESGSHKHPPADRPDHRTARERLDRLEQENAELRQRMEELKAWLRMLGCHLGYDPEALNFPPDEAS